MQEEQESELELILQVFQYSDYEYVVGLVDLNQLNSSDFAFTIHNVLAVTYDQDMLDFTIYESTIIDSTQMYNLAKHKVISIFSPSIGLEEDYYQIAQQIVDRELDLDVELEDDDQNLNNFLLIGKIQ